MDAIKSSEKSVMDVQLNMRVDSELKEALDKLCHQRYATTSGIVREAILDLLSKHGVPLPRSENREPRVLSDNDWKETHCQDADGNGL
tara:strand:+ start:145 stop:408 length:264 start_codon:yes stop_codon:yes gene_type:complete